MKSYVRRSCTIKCSDISSLDHIAVWFGKISDKKWQVFAFLEMKKKTYEKKQVQSQQKDLHRIVNHFCPLFSSYTNIEKMRD